MIPYQVYWYHRDGPKPATGNQWLIWRQDGPGCWGVIVATSEQEAKKQVLAEYQVSGVEGLDIIPLKPEELVHHRNRSPNGKPIANWMWRRIRKFLAGRLPSGEGYDRAKGV